MRFFRLTQFLLSGSLLIWGACKEAPKAPPPAPEPAPAPAPPPPPAEWIVVNQKSDITLFGKNVNLDEMKKGLLDSLTKMSVLPTEIPLKFEGEVMMGMRQEVETEIQEALEAARKKK